MGYVALLFASALGVSAVAGYFSIVGLMAIFPAAAMSILAMGIVLEVAKLVTASWLYQNWERANLLMKAYFVPAVAILSIITSMGIFGFLSKAHIDQGVKVETRQPRSRDWISVSHLMTRRLLVLNQLLIISTQLLIDTRNLDMSLVV